MTRQGKITAAVFALMLVLLAAAVHGVSRRTGKETAEGLLTSEEADLRYPYMTLDAREKALYSALYRGMTATAPGRRALPAR